MNISTKYIMAFLLVVAGMTAEAQQLPGAYHTDFSYAGYNSAIPSPGNIVTPTGLDKTGASDMATRIQSAIGALGSDGGVVLLPEGTYLIQSTLTINKSSVILRGAGSDKTKLIFDLSGTADPIAIKGLLPSTNNAAQYLSANAKRGSKTITLASNALPIATAGSLVLLYQDPGLKAYPGDSWAQTANSQQMLHVASVSGRTVTFREPLRCDFTTANNAYLRVVQAVRNVGLEDFYMECKNKQYSDPEQTSSPSNDNIAVDYADSCWIVGVESRYSNGAHVDIRRSANLQISGCYFHHGHGYGGGGSGYGVCITGGASQVLVANCIFDSLRHAMLIQGFANGNVFAYNYSARECRTDNKPYDMGGDAVLHGNWAHSNLFQGNIANNMVVDNPHGANGPRNVFLRNRFTSYGIKIQNLRTGSDDLLQENAGLCNDSTVLIGNEVTHAYVKESTYGTNNYYGSYTIESDVRGTLQIGNYQQNTVKPTGSSAENYLSFYNQYRPLFWDIADSWTGIGENNNSSIPAKARFDSASAKKTDSRKLLFADCVSAVPLARDTAYCHGQSAEQLSAAGVNLKWYAASVGGTASATAPTPTTSTVGTQAFYVSQTQAGCVESERAAVTVTVKKKPALVVMPDTSITAGSPVTLRALQSEGMLSWNVSPATVAPTQTTSYTATATLNGCASRDSVKVFVGGCVSPAPSVRDTSYCQGDNAAPLTATGSNLRWYSAPSGGTASSTAPTPGTASVGSQTFYVTQTTGSCTESGRARICVTVTAAKSDTCLMRSFKIGSVNGIIKDSIITIKMPQGTNLASLTPTLLISPRASVWPASGVAQDFTGSVTYTVTAENGTSKKRYHVTATVSTPTDANGEPAANVKVFPNPFSEVISVEVSGNAQVHLYSVSGKLFLHKNIYQNTNINTSQLPAGIYILSVTSNGGKANYTVTKK